MKVTDLPISLLIEAPWNSNLADQPILDRLKVSLHRYNMVQPLVVRSLTGGTFEVVGGNQRLSILRELGWISAPCVVVDLNEAGARLLRQALNHIHGEDDLGLRSELLRQVLESVPPEEVLELLPETADSLQALVSLGQQDISQYLQAWENAQKAKLKHLQLQLTRARSR